jgi:molybdopterin converting factor small subunit
LKVRITAPPFCDHSSIDNLGNIELAEGASLNDLYKKMKVAALLRPFLITSVNYEIARPSVTLSDGDDVSIFWPLSGG